jgi:hypothetical protein
MLRAGGKGGSAGGDLQIVLRWMQELALDPVAARSATAKDWARKRDRT